MKLFSVTPLLSLSYTFHEVWAVPSTSDQAQYFVVLNYNYTRKKYELSYVATIL